MPRQISARSDGSLSRVRRLCVLSCLAALTSLAMPVNAADDALLLGVIPRRSAAETAKFFTPLAEYLSRRIGREVKLVTSKSFDAFWADIRAQRYDVVHCNQYQYIRSSKDYKVIAVTQEFGRKSVPGVLFIRADSGIKSVSELRGKTVIFGGGKDAMLSYIAPRYLLLKSGLKERDFKSEFAVNPLNALVALYHKQADAAGGGLGLLEQPEVKSAIDTREIKVLASTQPLLFLPWTVKRSMPPKLGEAIQSALLDLKLDESGAKILSAAVMTGIEKAEDRDYDPHRRMTAEVMKSEEAGK